MVTLSHGRNFFKRPKRTSKFEHYFKFMVGITATQNSIKQSTQLVQDWDFGKLDRMHVFVFTRTFD
jgi:hypothetical protein